MSRGSLGLCEIVDRLTLTLELSNFDSDTFRIVSKFAIISKELYYKDSEKYSKSNSRTFLRRCIKITFACTWEMLTFFFAVFSFYRDRSAIHLCYFTLPRKIDAQFATNFIIALEKYNAKAYV